MIQVIAIAILSTLVTYGALVGLAPVVKTPNEATARSNAIALATLAVGGIVALVLG